MKKYFSKKHLFIFLLLLIPNGHSLTSIDPLKCIDESNNATIRPEQLAQEVNDKLESGAPLAVVCIMYEQPPLVRGLFRVKWRRILVAQINYIRDTLSKDNQIAAALIKLYEIMKPPWSDWQLYQPDNIQQYALESSDPEKTFFRIVDILHIADKPYTVNINRIASFD